MAVQPAPWLWLCALSELPPDHEIQRLHTGALDSISAGLPDMDQFWLGESDSSRDIPPTSAGDRVAAFLSQQRDMTTECTLPVLTRDMIPQLLTAYAPAGTIEFPRFPHQTTSTGSCRITRASSFFVRVGTRVC